MPSVQRSHHAWKLNKSKILSKFAKPLEQKARLLCLYFWFIFLNLGENLGCKWLTLSNVFTISFIQLPPRKVGAQCGFDEPSSILKKLKYKNRATWFLLLNLVKNSVSKVLFYFLLLFHDYWITFYDFTLWRAQVYHLSTLVIQTKKAEIIINFEFLWLAYIHKGGLLKLSATKICWQ